MAEDHEKDAIIVTGAGSGIGYALTRRLLDEGFLVSAWDIECNVEIQRSGEP